jgi:hypothetical protein
MLDEMDDGTEIIERNDTIGGAAPAISAQPNGTQESVDLTKKEEAKLMPRLLLGFNQYADARKEQESHWIDSCAIYEGRDGEDSQWPYTSRYEIPEAFRQTEGMKAFILNGFFSQPQWLEYKARHYGNEEDANISTHIVLWQLKHFDQEDDLMTWPMEVVHHGVSYCQYGWSHFKRLKYKFNRTENCEYDKQWEQESTEEMQGAPFVEYLSPWKVFHHPGVDKIEHSPLVYVVQHVSGDYLLTQARAGFFNLQQVYKALQEKNAIPRDVEIGEIGPDAELLGDPEFELMTVWTNGGRVYAIVNRSTMIQGNMNEYGEIPLLNQRNYQAPGNPFGISEPKQLQPEQSLIRDMMSMGVDSHFFKLQPMYIYNSDVARYFGDKDFAFRPGMAFQSDAGEKAIIPVTTQADSSQIFSNAERIRQYAQLRTNFTDIVAGTGTDGAQTAFAHGALQQAATSRLNAKMLLWETRLRKLYEKLHALNAAYLDERVAIQIEGVSGGKAYGRYKDGGVAYGDNPLGAGREVTPGFGVESFTPEVDVEVKMPRTMEAPQQRQVRLMTLWNAISQDPRWAVEPVMEEIGRAFEFPSPKRLIVRPATAQRDAAKENADFLSNGVIPEPLSSDDHQIHLELHAYLPQMPTYQNIPQTLRAQFLQHMQIHQSYLQQIQQMTMGQSGVAAPAEPTQGDGTSPEIREQSSQMAEETSAPGMMGASEMGAMA